MPALGHETGPPIPVTVTHRIYDRPVTAMLAGRVLYSDQLYFRHAGPRRYFWLLDEDVQLVYEPFGWRDEWYIDMVAIRRDDGADRPCFQIEDRYVDIVVEGMGPTYRILDLDEAGTALESGAESAEGLRRTLTGAQRFLDRYLHRGAPFPPPQIRSLFSAEHHYPSWAAEPVRLKAAMPG